MALAKLDIELGFCKWAKRHGGAARSRWRGDLLHRVVCNEFENRPALRVVQSALSLPRERLLNIEDVPLIGQLARPYLRRLLDHSEEAAIAIVTDARKADDLEYQRIGHLSRHLSRIWQNISA